MITFLSILILMTVNICTSDDDISEAKPTPTPYQDWDYIVYSQRWPITGCEQWKERSSKNTCNMPQDNKTWVVHGVWPTKIGTKGPYFCNSAIHFDPDQLQPMMDDLNEYWPNIEANTKANSFWKHEWAKHGTCASTLPQLDSVTNYFKRGLQWNQDYKMADILTKEGIVPNLDGYNVSFIYDTIKTVVGKSPTVECVVDGKTKESLISEIRLCFNKDLNLIDCSKPDSLGDDVLSNCNLIKNIMYYAEVPNNTISENWDYEFDSSSEEIVEDCLENYYFQADLLKFYNLIKFLMWFTL